MVLNTDTYHRLFHNVPDFPLASLVCCKFMPLLGRLRHLPVHEFPGLLCICPHACKCWWFAPTLYHWFKASSPVSRLFLWLNRKVVSVTVPNTFNYSPEYSCVFNTVPSLKHKHTENNENQIAEYTFASLFRIKYALMWSHATCDWAFGSIGTISHH